jgi:ATP-dependent DNA helicase RecQ
MAERELGGQLLKDMEAFAEASVCRRKFILHYFGERFDQKNCGMCDNCVNPKEAIEGKDYIHTVLKIVKAVGENYGIEYIVKIAAGKVDQQIVLFGHDKLKEFGSGKQKDELFWNSVVRQALINNFIRKDIEQYGLLKLTEEGKDFLKKPISVQITLNHNYETVEDTDDDDVITNTGSTGTGALDSTLQKMLKDLVKKVAKEKNLPPFVIFQEPSLNDMATLYPTTLEELENCQGVSKGKAVRYGKPFVEIIAKYVEENNIERPLDMLIKTIANKSANKVQIIQNIDKKIPLDEIARQRNISMVDLMTELETIVSSGTKLNLVYYIDQHIDEYTQKDIFDYFKTAETDDIATAVNELGKEDFDYEQVQLMRIKFMSELGN